jgi:D-alanyl-lipoteichoic acid acyltransferase DltB (MBOAT superfamily)
LVSSNYLLALPILVALYLLSQSQITRLCLLLLGGAITLWSDGWTNFLLILVLLVMTWWGAVLIQRYCPGNRKALGLLIALEISPLLLHKFIKAGLWGLVDPAWLEAQGLTEWLPPLGLSVMTFQAVSYLVMVGRSPALARSWPDVLLFLSFWPTLFAGPIWRAEDFFAQTDDPRPARRVGRPRQAWLALYLIALGLVQKVVLASWLSAQVVDPVNKFPDHYASVSLAAAMLGYSLQIFLDFAGYTLIVTGLALLLGYRLPINFRQPYLARNLSDFWTRWHVSLSSFIRDYIYIPMGGNRLGWGRTQLNVLLGMLISGLWHGANWTFVVWGLLHGLGVVVQNTAKRLGMRAWPRWAAQIPTFVFVSVAWVFFRAESVPQALHMLQGLWHSPAGFWLPEQLPWSGLLGIAALVWGLSPRALWWQRQSVAWLARMGPWLGGSILGSLGTFPDIWFSAAEYKEWGAKMLHRKIL